MGIAITFCVLGGLVTGVLASTRHRSVAGWFAIGSLFPLLGLILILALPPDVAPARRTVACALRPRERVSATVIGQRTHLQTTTLDAVDRLVELKQRGQLTDLEFQERRAELLARIDLHIGEAS